MTLLGFPFETDHEGIVAYLSNGQQHRVEDMQKLFPGFLQVCIKAVKEIESKRVRVGRLEYKKGKVTAYPDKQFDVPPSEAFIYLLEKSA
jgi:hypothetical protein